MGWRTGLIVGIVAALPATAQASTFNVTKQQDTNDHACTPSQCSLRDAIIASNATAGPNVITLHTGHYKLTIPGKDEHAAETGDLNITKSVTINGAGASKTTIDGNHIDRVFELLSGANLTVSGVTVTGGLANSTAIGALDAGGAVLDNGGASVTFTNSAIDGNVASGTNASGGGIEVETSSTGAVTLTNTTATANRAGGSTATDYGYGGVIDNDGTGTVRLTHVTMTGNRAGGDGAGGYGGAVKSQGGPMVVSSSTFADNVAGGAGAFGYGGALNVLSATITGSSFRTNHAGGGGGGGFGYGGAIELETTVTLTRSELTGNNAGGGGDNTGTGAFGYGGAVDGLGGAVTLTNSNVSGNVAGGGDPDSFGYGGGVNASVIATGSTISGNTAGGGGGFGHGGGISGEAPRSALTNSTVSGNSAGGGGSGGFGSGGGIWQASGPLTLTFSDVVGNSALAVMGSGGGGGVDGTLTSNDSIVADNVSGLGANCLTPATSQGHNIENGTTCGFAMSGDLHAEPHLGPLTNNGGPTPTRMPLSGSAAINNGDLTGCAATDQRGVHRPEGIACDIGAYELAPPTATTVRAAIGTAGHVQLVGRADNPDAVSGTGYFQYGKTAAYGKQVKGFPLPAGADEQLSIPVGKLAANTRYHYRAVARNPDGISFGSDKTFRTPAAPVLRKLQVHPDSFRPKDGATITYMDSASGTTTFTILHGHKKVGRFTHKSKAGHNHVQFSGKVRGKALVAGDYTLRARATNAFGTTGHAVSTQFRIQS